MFELRNLSDAATLTPNGSPHVFFRRFRALCAGQLIEDINHYNRTHEMLRYVPLHHRANLKIESYSAEDSVPTSGHRIVLMSFFVRPFESAQISTITLLPHST